MAAHHHVVDLQGWRAAEPLVERVHSYPGGVDWCQPASAQQGSNFFVPHEFTPGMGAPLYMGYFEYFTKSSHSIHTYFTMSDLMSWTIVVLNRLPASTRQISDLFPNHSGSDTQRFT